GAVRQGAHLRAPPPPLGGEQPLPQGPGGGGHAAVGAVSRRQPRRVHRADRPSVLHRHPGPSRVPEPPRRPPSAVRRAHRGGAGPPPPERSRRRVGGAPLSAESGFEVVSTRTIGEGVFLRLEEVILRSPTGEEVKRDVIRHPGGVAVLPIDGDQVWLIRQHRVALGREVDEIPAGKLDVDGEDVADAARRELLEALGATPRRLEHLATMAPAPGYTDEIIEIYVAEGLDFTERAPQGAEEHGATFYALPIAEALDRISRGELTDAKTLIALLEWNRRRA